MSANTSIQWTDRTWNPVRGCSVVSEGCKNCYAMHVGARFSGPGLAYEGLALNRPARWTGVVRVVEKDLDAPLRWRKPCRVFVNSMSDLFHESLTDGEIDKVFAVMAAAPRHTFQVLTKRPARMREYLARLEASAPDTGGDVEAGVRHLLRQTANEMGWPMDEGRIPYSGGWPLPNVWLGVSVENQARADERILTLVKTPAAVRFLSIEPLLGPVDVRLALATGLIHWVIVGGESGRGARPFEPWWARQVRDQCREAGVAFFMKQYGANVDDGVPFPTTENSLRDSHGGDMAEWPEDLRVREFPTVRA